MQMIGTLPILFFRFDIDFNLSTQHLDVCRVNFYTFVSAFHLAIQTNIFWLNAVLVKRLIHTPYRV